MLKKFMAAASVAALVAGSASAQLALELSPVDTGAPGASAGDATISAPGYRVANEVDFSALNAAAAGSAGIGYLGLEVLTDGSIPSGQNVFLRLELTGATIAGTLTGNDELGGTGPGAGSGAGVANSGATAGSVNAGGTNRSLHSDSG